MESALAGRHKFKEELIATAKAIVRPGFGILAADESTGTMGSRLEKIKVENTEENRRWYRESLFTTDGMENYISGVIMFEETLDQKTAEGKNFVELLKEKNVITGIKVDQGLAFIEGTKEEQYTKGHDGLDERCRKYYEKGARFAKWRAVLKIGDGRPSDIAIRENAQGLAKYAAICQDNGLVPIVEPEILTDGNHSIDVCAEVSERVFAACQWALLEHKCIIEGCLLKPNMVTPGAECAEQKTPAEVAWYTVRTLSRSILPSLPGIVFLSGGQSEESASIHLSAMNKVDAKCRPWSLTFSYGRALQSSALKAWSGDNNNRAACQAAFLERAKANGLASKGEYEGGSGDSESLYVKNYSY